jgi:hypothetical protein
MSNVMRIHRKLCEHGRWPWQCVRCDLWCPANATESQKDAWQGWADQIREAAKESADNIVHLPGGVRVKLLSDDPETP